MAKKRKKYAPLIERREPYLRIFLLGFIILMLTMAPVMIFTGGYFVYYGDFNSQQIPFYQLAHDAVRSGSFGWNWQTDLGANFIGSYSFYLLGSPFFWLTALFPSSAVPFLIPWLLALKHGVASVTAYAYIRRFVRSRRASMIGALLYAYSGFQLFNVFFNHFQDVTAFFPLLLLAMEQRVNENRRGVFALATAFMAVINYYFFTGQIVFCVLYFICRCTAPDFNANLRKFFSLALEGLIGTLMACFMLLPSALAIIDNYRVRSYLFGLDMVAYSDRTRLWHIVQSFFMLPDAPARPNLFRTEYGKWASIGGYFPMFSMAGVLAFMSRKKKHWATRIVAVCAVCACIPVLNSMFYLFNSSYYARWYYMPLLIMAMMTAYALDNPKIKWRGGIVTCAVMLGLFSVIALLPRKDDEGKIVLFDFAQYTWYFWLILALCAAMLYFTVLVIVYRERGRRYQQLAVVCTVFSCFCSSFAMIYFGIGLGAYPMHYVSYAINGGREISLEAEEDQFFRVDIAEDYDNYPMLWGYSNMRCFHSIVPVSIMDFYDEVDVTRDVASRADLKHYPLRALFNVKYYFDKIPSEQAADYDYTIGLPGFEYLKKENSFYIYENKAYLPMGMAYEYAIDTDALRQTTPLAQEKLMLKALGMSKEQLAEYADAVQPLPESEQYAFSDAQYVDYCLSRRADTCDTFTYDSYGFDASITLEKPKMVFFSVPYEEGWHAEVNGKAVDIARVNYGFMAVRAEAGDNQITFRYETPGLKAGALASACGLGALILYLLCAALAGNHLPAAKHKRFYDYVSALPMTENQLYLRYAAQKRQLLPPPEPKQKEVQYESGDHSEERTGQSAQDPEHGAEQDASGQQSASGRDAYEPDAAGNAADRASAGETDAEPQQQAGQPEQSAAVLDKPEGGSAQAVNLHKPLTIDDILSETASAQSEKEQQEHES